MDDKERAHCEAVLARWSNESDSGYVQVSVEELARERADAHEAGIARAIWKYDTIVEAYDQRGRELAHARDRLERVRALLVDQWPNHELQRWRTVDSNEVWFKAIKKALGEE